MQLYRPRNGNNSYALVAKHSHAPTCANPRSRTCTKWYNNTRVCAFELTKTNHILLSSCLPPHFFPLLLQSLTLGGSDDTVSQLVENIFFSTAGGDSIAAMTWGFRFSLHALVACTGRSIIAAVLLATGGLNQNL